MISLDNNENIRAEWQQASRKYLAKQNSLVGTTGISDNFLILVPVSDQLPYPQFQAVLPLSLGLSLCSPGVYVCMCSMTHVSKSKN